VLLSPTDDSSRFLADFDTLFVGVNLVSPHKVKFILISASARDNREETYQAGREIPI
jgi:hypothetical protein